MGRLTRRLKNVIETSHWRHWFRSHRLRRLTIVLFVVAVVVTFILIGLQTWRITFGRPSAEIPRSFISSFPSFSSLSSSSSFSLFSSFSSSSSSSSRLSSVSPSNFSSIFPALQLLKPINPSPGIRHASGSSSSSSTSEPHIQSISGVSSRSSSSLPPTLQALDALSITDARYTESSKNPIEYHDCPRSASKPPPFLNDFPDPLPLTDEQSSPHTWQRMEAPAFPGHPTVSYLFAAYYDPRSRPPNVAIVGLTSNFYHFFVNFSASTMVPANYFCQFRYRNSSEFEATTAVFSFVGETHGKRYAASFHTCYIRHDKIPYAVSLVTDRCISSPSNLLRVQFSQMPSQPPERDFTVCVTPLNNNYDNYHQLVEMIEVNRMFGAEKFVFYNYSTGTNILPYLRSYEEEGIVEVVPWRLPVTADPWPDNPGVVPMVHYFGQLAALNDCLYRNMFASRFVVFTDLDEIIVPRGRYTTWTEVLEAATRRKLGNPPFGQTQAFPGAYVIQNTFFRSDWGDDPRANEDQVARDLMLRTLLKTNRETVIYPWYSRSKCMVWTKAVFTVGIHSVSGFVDDQKVVAVNVDAADALLHHYRLTMWPEDPKNPLRPTQDRQMHRFYEEITNRTLDRHNRLRQRNNSTKL